MYQAGQMQMQSVAWLQNHGGDRPSFQATVSRTFSTRQYQVFAMSQGLLFLELRTKGGSPGTSNQSAVVMGAVMGGAIGACIAGALTSQGGDPGKLESFDLCSEEELFAIAKQRRKSFVSKTDEVISVSIDAPGSFGRLFGSSTLAGWITLRDRKVGKVSMEIHDQASMSVAVDALPRRFKERCFVNVELDRQTAKFKPKGR
jgi:hypothetical protein